MWNLRNTLTPFLFVLLATGCTAEDPAVPALPIVSDTAEVQPVCFSLCESSATPVATRAGTSPLPAGETVRVLVYRTGSTSATNFMGENTYLVDPNQGGRLTPCTVDATGMVTGPGEELFLVPGQTYDIHAYSPALPSVNHLTVNDIGHGTDMMGSKMTMKLEKFTPSVTLAPLVHQCALTEFTIQADPTDPSVLELSAESVTLTSMSRAPGSYTLNSTTGVSPTGTTRDGTVKIEAFNKLTDTQISASQVVLPKATGNFTLNLDVLINGTKYSLSAPVNNLALQANTKYSWVVTCKRQGITLSFSVVDWQGKNDLFDSNAGTPAPLQEPANSFMVTPGRGISFKAVRADGSALNGIAKAEVLWQTRDGATPVIERPAHVVWDSENQRIRVYTNTKATNGGKVVVVARNTSNAEVYRWLVWITPYNPWGALNGELKTANRSITAGVLPGGAAVHTYDANFLAANGKQSVMMDRNLGATAPTDAGCNFQHGSRMAYQYGSEALYQADGATPYTQPAVPSTAPANGWTAVTINGTSATGAKSVEDPCPYGWRVPANNGTATSTWSAFTTATFTASGSGRMYGNGVNAYYPIGCWGANRAGGTNGYALLFAGGSVSNTGSQSAITPLPVRCVQDAVSFEVGTPKMEAVTVSSISATGATFNSRMTSTGGATITERGFYYHTQTFVNGVGAKSVKALEAVSEPAFTAGVTGLTQGTTYYVQAYIRTSGGTFYSPLVQFVPSALPKVSTDNATSSAPTTATVSGTVADTGGDAAVKRGVVYSTTSNFDPQSQGTQVAAGTNGSGSYTINLTGLQPGTVYFVRAYATNKIATGYGVQRSFTTLGVPLFSDLSYVNLTGTTVTFRSTLIGPLPTPGVTSWGFEWSSNADFPAGTGTASAAVAGPYTTGKTFAFDATGLKDNTTYYVRAYGVNVAGKGYSSPVRFVTLQLPKVATLAAGGATYIGKDGKVPTTFNGEVTAIGSSYPTDWGFEYSTTPGFAGGTGTRAPVGGGGTLAGKFAGLIQLEESDRTYYIRAYATNSAGRGYGDIRSVQLNYVAPTFNGVTPKIAERRINTLRASMTGTPQLGNAQVIEQGYAYQEAGSSDYIYSTNGTPRLKVYKKYTVYVYLKNAKGVYYSPTSTSETTYKNYYTYEGKEYVIDKSSGGGHEEWATGVGSLIGMGNDYLNAGYHQTRKLVNKDGWDFHPRAAKFCWDKPTVHGQRWFLGVVGFQNDVFTDLVKNPSVYDPSIMVDKNQSYWASTEFATMSGELSYWSSVLERFILGTMGKNQKRMIRCVRYRTLTNDEYGE